MSEKYIFAIVLFGSVLPSWKSMYIFQEHVFLSLLTAGPKRCEGQTQEYSGFIRLNAARVNCEILYAFCELSF